MNYNSTQNKKYLIEQIKLWHDRAMMFEAVNTQWEEKIKKLEAELAAMKEKELGVLRLVASLAVKVFNP